MTPFVTAVKGNGMDFTKIGFGLDEVQVVAAILALGVTACLTEFSLWVSRLVGRFFDASDEPSLVVDRPESLEYAEQAGAAYVAAAEAREAGDHEAAYIHDMEAKEAVRRSRELMDSGH